MIKTNKNIIVILFLIFIYNCDLIYSQENESSLYSGPDDLNTALIKSLYNELPINDVEILIDAGADINTIDRHGNTPLMIALDKRNLELAEYFLNKGSEINVSDKNKITAIRLAVQKDFNETFIRKLLKNGADVNAADYRGFTPLMSAIIYRKEIELVRLLLEYDADVMARDNKGKRAEDFCNYFTDKEIKNIISIHTRRGDIAESLDVNDYNELFKEDPVIETARAYIDAGGDVNSLSYNKISPFFMACFIGADPEIIRLFLSHGADPNQIFEWNMTPLMVISANNVPELETYKILIDAGADLNIQNNDGFTAAMYTTVFQVDDYVYDQHQQKKTTNEQISRLIIDMKNQKRRNLDFMIKSGADINIKDLRGNTCLNNAVDMYMEHEIIEILVKANSELNSINQRGRSAIMVGAMHKNPRIVEVLLDAGADLNIKDSKGQTLWDYVKKYELLYGSKLYNKIKKLCGMNEDNIESVPARQLFEVMKYLPINPQSVMNYIKSGGDVNVTNDDGDTLLILASITADNALVFKLLIDAGADINARDKNKSTPLFLASANQKNTDIIKSLISAGADINSVNNAEMTPLFAAIYNKSENREIISLLTESGANINMTDKNGKTPLILALIQNRVVNEISLLINSETVNRPEKNGWTPLMLASGNQHPLMIDIIPLLLESGAEINRQNNNGMTAIRIAAEGQINPEILSLLIKNGADINITDDKEMNALDYMRENNALNKSKLFNELIHQ